MNVPQSWSPCGSTAPKPESVPTPGLKDQSDTGGDMQKDRHHQDGYERRNQKFKNMGQFQSKGHIKV